MKIGELLTVLRFLYINSIVYFPNQTSTRRSPLPSGTRFPATSLPSTVILVIPLQTPCGLWTVMCTSPPRNLRVAEKPSHADGMHGSTRRPLYSGRMPKIHCVAAWYDHEAVPESHELRASPNCGCSSLRIFCA